MFSKNQIKHIRQLKTSKYRQQFGEFIAEGPKVVGELMKSQYTIKTIYAIAEWADHQADSDSRLSRITAKELDQISLLKTPNQVLCIVEIPKQKNIQSIENTGLTLILDGINDPGNMGTIIRTADWFGIKTIICSPNCVHLYNPKTVQSTMGSISRVSVHYTPLESFLENIPASTKIYGAYLEGDNIYKTDLQKNGLLVIGSESHGISKEVGHFVNHKLTIPQMGETRAESLNASVATAILCSEFMRR